MRVSWFTLASLTVAISRAAGEAFYRVVDAAYEHGSIAVTSNLHPGSVRDGRLS